MKSTVLELFDCNAMLGRAPENQGGSLDDVEALREHMQRYCIAKSLVYSPMAKYHVPVLGNAMLSEMAVGQPDIYTAWVALPHHTGEFPAPTELAEQMKRQRVSAIRLCPKTHGYSTSYWSCGALLDKMNSMRMPVFLDYDIQHWADPYPWEDVARLCRTYPQTPFILTRVGCGANRNLYPLLDQCENLYMEISYYDTNRGLEDIARRFGASRMLFGTDAPVHAPACPIGLLWYSDLRESEKRMVASENLQTLLEGVRFDG